MTDDFEMPTPAATAAVTTATTEAGDPPASAAPAEVPVATVEPVTEQGGPPGPEPTRFGDWERKGRCIDF